MFDEAEKGVSTVTEKGTSAQEIATNRQRFHFQLIEGVSQRTHITGRYICSLQTAHGGLLLK